MHTASLLRGGSPSTTRLQHPGRQQNPLQRPISTSGRSKQLPAMAVGGGWLDNILARKSSGYDSENNGYSSSDSEVSPMTPTSKKLRDYAEVAYLSGRHTVISEHFPNAMGIDDFIYRMEIALFGYGFHGDNSIAMVNLCRDEITVTLKQKLDQVFGCAFNTNGLGGVLTCGVTGVSAGLSHAPISQGSGKERYVFFSFPHISIDAAGEIGTISRPGRPGASCACGALNKALVEIKRDGVTSNCKIPGVHEPLDPEFTILKQRLARRLRYEGVKDGAINDWNLARLTALAERTITDDLEYLISKTVDPKKADYAVVTGIQIHNWGQQFDNDSPNLEFIAPENVYVVVNGEKTRLNLKAMPSFTPRQVRLLSDKAGEMGGHKGHAAEMVCNNGGSSTLKEIDPPYLYNSREIRRRKRERGQSYLSLIAEEGLEPENTCEWPSWQTQLRVSEEHHIEGGNSAIHFEQHYAGVDNMSAEQRTKLQTVYDAASPPPKSNNGNGNGSRK